ncbi:signal peptidase II [Pedobacter sp. AW31-3R]|uniref:signal peptidase II n=1 Tax=Pedobacter sp. AW31-3R TaxID=3445781 RepID=UPI003FA10FDA
MKVKLRNIYILLVIFINVGVDQLTKYIAREQLMEGEVIQVVSEHFMLTKTENHGAFLSVGDQMPASIKFIFLMLLPAIALCFGIYFLLINDHLHRIFVVGLCFVIGGGIGNLYDRMVYGSVTDFLHIDYLMVKTGIFNIADVSIMIGMACLLLNIYLKYRNNREEEFFEEEPENGHPPGKESKTIKTPGN